MMRRFSLLFLIAPLAIIPAHATENTNGNRLAEVAQRGAQVMPFDLKKTIHVFSKTAKGGMQQVIATDRSDTEQISLIRAHLLEISDEFQQGDFSKPAKIHGETMPGMAELKAAKTGEIKIEYQELPDGAEINYFTTAPKYIKAIHQWFDAQLGAHARHAAPSHPHK